MVGGFSHDIATSKEKTKRRISHDVFLYKRPKAVWLKLWGNWDLAVVEHRSPNAFSKPSMGKWYDRMKLFMLEGRGSLWTILGPFHPLWCLQVGLSIMGLSQKGFT